MSKTRGVCYHSGAIPSVNLFILPNRGRDIYNSQHTMAISMEMQQPSAVDRDVEEAYAKQNMEFIESAADVNNPDTIAAQESRLSKPHRDYLIERHGTFNLDPIPAMDPADPYNWPEWKVSSPVIWRNKFHM